MKQFTIIECEKGYLVKESDHRRDGLELKIWCYLKLEDALDRLKKLFEGDDGLGND